MSDATVTAINRHQLAAQVKQFARARLGFDLVGVAPIAAPSRAEYFRQWLDDGKAGVMEYLADRFDERVEPDRYLPGAKTAVCVALNYNAKLEPVPEDQKSHHARVARYALGDDYHELIKHKLYDLADWIREQVPGSRTRCGVDTVPVLERDLAARAGIGWVGKNTCVINREIGSWILLGEVLTTIDLPADDPVADACGTCTRCIDACPTGAITSPYQLDARRCISYLNIEQSDPIPPDYQRAVGEWLFGCDICQDVCPHNSRVPETNDAALQPRFKTGTIDLRDLMNWKEDDWRRTFRGSAMKRVKLPVLQRNAWLVQENLQRKEGTTG